MNQLLFILLLALPRIDLGYNTLAADTFNAGTFCFTYLGDTISLNMQVRHRGNWALKYDKPSYAIKLTDSIGQNADTSFLGMRTDNYWILDAMAVDHARMRNRVSMDLWLEFSRKPWYYADEPKLINGYRGHMVEVYWNNQPRGIYCLMERVDRKQLKLKKYSEKKGIQGILYKPWRNTSAAAWLIPYPTNIPDDTKSVWDSWEVQYPDLEDGEPITWAPLYNSIKFAQKTDQTFLDSIGEYVDLPVFIDYILFTQLLSARDNDRKNIYVSYYTSSTKRGVYTPWDLDHALGRQYNGDAESPTATGLFNGHRLYQRLNTYCHLQDSLRERYTHLRQHFFTVEHIDSLCAPYFELFAATGCDTLEQRLWSGPNGIEFDIASEQAYIHNWMEARLMYLDSIYSYAPPAPHPTQLHSAMCKDSHPKLLWYHQQIYILKGKDIYDIYGRKISAPSSMVSPQ